MTVLGFHNGPELVMFLTSLLTGITMVMGVNAVNSAPSFMLDYYKYIAKDVGTLPQYPTFWSNVLNFYTVVTFVAQTVHEPTNLTTFMCRFSLLFRLEMSIVLMIVELLVIVLLPHTGATEVGAMAAIVVVAYLGGAARAYFENTGYALFGPCPSKMLSGMLIGSAVSGAIVSIIQIILIAAMPSTHSAVLTQSILYFSLAMGIIFVAALLLMGLLINPFAKRYIAEFRSHRNPLANIYRPLKTDGKAAHASGDAGAVVPAELVAADQSQHCPIAAGVGEEESMTPGKGSTQEVRQSRGELLHMFEAHEDDVLFDDRVRHREEAMTEPAFSVQAPDGDSQRLQRKLGEVDGAAALHSDSEDVASADDQALTTSEILQGVRLWPVIKKIYPMMISCLLAFMITYLMYPGILLAVDPDDDWYTTLIMATFNFGDLIGRAITLWKRLWPPRKVIVIGAVSRAAFIPLLLLCALGKIPGHAPAYVFTALLGLSNGFFGTLSMVYAPNTPSLRTDGERAIAGQATGVCLLLGCAVGSLIQLAEVLPFN